MINEQCLKMQSISHLQKHSYYQSRFGLQQEQNRSITFRQGLNKDIGYFSKVQAITAIIYFPTFTPKIIIKRVQIQIFVQYRNSSKSALIFRLCSSNLILPQNVQQKFKSIILTVMNYNSPETLQAPQNKNASQQSRTRLTLLADISEANPSGMQTQQESPVLTYLRQLQDNKSQAQKQNNSNFNRKISQSQDRNDRKNANKQATLKQQNPRKQLLINACQNWEQAQNKSQSRQTKTQSQSNRRQFQREGSRPGIERYRKLINLAEPIENLEYQHESMFQKSKFKSEYFNEDEDLLFKKQLKKYNPKKFKP